MAGRFGPKVSFLESTREPGWCANVRGGAHRVDVTQAECAPVSGEPEPRGIDMRQHVKRRLMPAVATVLAMLLSGALAGSVQADPVADFYAGRTVTLVSGFTPNGENDLQLRLLGRFLGRFIPGQPQVVIAGMPGAGTLLSANHLKKAPADGTTAAMFTSQAAVEPFLGNTAAVFEPLKLGWIGSMSQDRQFCGVVSGPGVATTFDDLLKQETVFGASAPTSDIYRYTAAVKNLLGAKIKIVSGYAGMPAIRLALDRGEVSGVCGLTESVLRTTLAPDLASGRLKLLVQMGRTATSEYGDVPSVFDFARDERTRNLLEFFFKALAIGRPIAVPAGVPAERIAALRMAFTKTLEDPAFLAEAKTIDLIVNPTSATEIEAQRDVLSHNSRQFFEDVIQSYR